MANIPPRKVIADQLIYPAINVQDSSDRFMLVAEHEVQAKELLIDKLGYKVKLLDGYYFMVDADNEVDDEPVLLDSTMYQRALNEVMEAARWRLGEPVEMIGGDIGDGFSGYDQ